MMLRDLKKKNDTEGIYPYKQMFKQNCEHKAISSSV